MPVPSTEDVELVVDLAGLIDIFGDALYREFGAVVRELVQNGHDAITVACANSNDPWGDLTRNRIDIVYHGNEMFVADTGIGLSRSELARKLNHFAQSKKRQVQDSLSSDRAGTALQIIGEYGVGFLAAMAVSDEVEVLTCSAGAASRWLYQTGASKARVADIPLDHFARSRDRALGHPSSARTVVRCKLSMKAIADYYIDDQLVRDSAERFAKILPIAVYVNGTHVNTLPDAWVDPSHATESSWATAIEEMGFERPLLVIPLFSPPDQLDLQGVLWIPPRKAVIGAASLRVYIKRMFVMDDDDVILPKWARFVTGMINTNKVRRIVSGNTAKENRETQAARKFVKDRIIDSFQRLRTSPEEDYWRIIGPHDDLIKESAVDNEEFIECVWDKLRLRVRGRRMTLPEYLEAIEKKVGKREVYYYDKHAQEFSANLVADSTGIPVVSLCGRDDHLFVERVCKRQGMELLSFRGLADNHFRPPANADSFQTLVASCAENNVLAEVREYEPRHVPAVLIEDKSLQERREELLRGLRSTGGRHLADDLDRLFRQEHAANRGVAFYLNASNELVQTLRHVPFQVQSAICLALYNISFMAAMPELKRNEVQLIYDSLSSVLLNLIKAQGSLSPPKKRVPVRIFVMMPFGDAYRNVEQAIRSVFECAPYFFEVALARDFMFQTQLLSSLRDHLEAADAFVADVSDLNPNVLLELGATLVNNDGRPVFTLRSSRHIGMPVDIQAQLCIEYPTSTSAVDEIVGSIRAAIERNGRPVHADVVGLMTRRSCRALTRTLLFNHLGARLRQEEVGSLLKHYPTLDEFLAGTSEEVAMKTGVPRPLIDLAREELLRLE